MSRLTKEERRTRIAKQYAKMFDIPELASVRWHFSRLFKWRNQSK